jgi:hypothetical protein
MTTQAPKNDPKILWLWVMVIILILIAVLSRKAQAQDAKDVYQIVHYKNSAPKLNTEPGYQYPADVDAKNILNAYFYSEQMMDIEISTLDASWYFGMDMYVDDNWKSLVKQITNAKTAYWLEKRLSYVVISVEEIDGVYLVMIYSIP